MCPDEFVIEPKETPDPQTGRPVRQITDGQFECVAPYMDRQAWSADEKYVMFMCNRTGSWQPYRMELATGRAQQLYETSRCGKHGFYAQAVDAARDEAYFPDGPRFIAVNLHTLESRVAADLSEDIPASDPWAAQPVLSGDGALIYAHWRPGSVRATAIIARTDGGGVIRRIALDAPFTHPCHEQFCPTDNNVISICGLPDHQDDVHADPMLRVREWRLDVDSGQLRPLVLMPPGYRATHCVWGRSGRRLYFHRKTSPWHVWVPTALCSVDKEGGDFRVYCETSRHRLGHSCPSPDEKWIVTDSQDPGQNILMLVSLERDEQHLLCWPNMSIDADRPDRRASHLPAHTHRHTHPAFSPRGTYVHYTSDVTGRSQVYVVRVDDLVAAD